jgi:hypothetical protein
MTEEGVDSDMVKLLDALDEAQRRWFLAREAARIGAILSGTTRSCRGPRLMRRHSNGKWYFAAAP